jgi:hypothetical protein
MKYLFFILFLITLGGFLLFYNFKYLPLEEKIIKISDENLLWQKEVVELKQKLAEYENKDKARLTYTFEFRELFWNEYSDTLNPAGEARLKSIIPSLKENNNKVAILFYGEDLELPPNLKKKFPTPYHFGLNRALVVFNYLINMGFPKERLLIMNDCEKKNKKNVLAIQVLNY